MRIFSAIGLRESLRRGTRAYVGSAACSAPVRESELIEAMVVTADRRRSPTPKQFVADLCLHDLGPDALAELQKLYRAPKSARRSAQETFCAKAQEMALPRVFIAQTTLTTWPE
ncbi:MAG: hypothetical protein U0704_05690 [Candidatus Eisenbacteria bacterium]